METRLKQRIETGHPIIEWMVRHSSAVLNRYQIGVDGRAPNQRLKGKAFKRVVAELGEQIHCSIADPLKKNPKDEVRWEIGHFVGVRDQTGEILVANCRGGC